jgi:hypothetical protein
MNYEDVSLSHFQGPHLTVEVYLSALTEFDSKCYSLLSLGFSENEHQQMMPLLLIT